MNIGAGFVVPSFPTEGKLGAASVYDGAGKAGPAPKVQLVQYNHSDWLGSARLLSSPARVATTAMAYAPFGEGYAGGAPYVQFTGGGNDWTVYDSENDTGSLVDFMFRRYSPTQGRWISPDPAGLSAVDPSNPQSWNRYAYVLNNPLRFIDPSGLILCDYGPSDYGGEDFENADDDTECVSNGGSTVLDRTNATVNGGNAGDVETIENGQQIYPQIVQPQQSYANCVKNAGNYFSLQHGLQAASGGNLGNSWLSGALLGNPFSDVIAFGQGLASGNGAEAGSSGSSAALGFYDPAGRTLEAATQLQDVTVVTSSVTATSVTLPGASVTSVSLNATSQTIPLSTLGAIAKPFLAVAKGLNVWNYGVTSFAGFVCGIGR
jgi:RHS repeat-associated protein